MGTTKPDLEQDVPNFDYTTTAEILGVTKGNITQIVQRGRIQPILNGKGKKRIPSSEILAYAVKTGRKDIPKIKKRIENQARTKINQKTFFKLLMAGLGIYFLYEASQD